MHPETQKLVAEAVRVVSDEQNERDAMKQVVKAAIREWLDEKFAQFGKWSFAGILAAALGLLCYFLLLSHGWRAPPQ